MVTLSEKQPTSEHTSNPKPGSLLKSASGIAARLIGFVFSGEFQPVKELTRNRGSGGEVVYSAEMAKDPRFDGLLARLVEIDAAFNAPPTAAKAKRLGQNYSESLQ